MPSESTEKILTPANVVTLIRICLVPVFVVALISPWPELAGADDLVAFKPWVAALIFIAISCTDWLDGYLARSRNEVTDFGKFMDPLADKILVVAALLVLIELGALPSWPVLIIVAREFIVSGVRMVAASKGEVIAASWYGKFKTVFQMIAIVLFVVKESPIIADVSHAAYVALYVLSWIVMFIALGLTIVSMMDYISKARHLIGLRPKGSRKGAGSAAMQATSLGEDACAAPGARERECAQEGSGTAAAGSLCAALETESATDASSVESVADLAQRAVKAAQARGISLAAAESCTGGMVSAAIVGVPGASDVFKGSVVSYTNEVKRDSLGVSADDLATHGAVSEPVARQMAEGAARALCADAAVSITGIAGPGGAVPGKPVGTVWVGASCNGETRAVLHHFKGNRSQVREASTRAALALLLDMVEGHR